MPCLRRHIASGQEVKNVIKNVAICGDQKSHAAKRSADNRVADFDEIYNEFNAEAAETQASRCSQCGVPFCQVNCPLHNNIPDWLMMTAEGRMQEAYELSAQTNNFPEICGRICPRIACAKAVA